MYEYRRHRETKTNPRIGGIGRIDDCDCTEYGQTHTDELSGVESFSEDQRSKDTVGDQRLSRNIRQLL